MRDYAKVSPRLWTGSLGKSLRGDSDAQALAAFLVSCQHSNMIGLYFFPLGYAALDLGWSAKKVAKALERLVAVGFAKYDQENERVWVVESARHEFGERLEPSDKRVRGIENKLVDHLISPLAVEFACRYGGAFNLNKKLLDRLTEGPSKPLRSQDQEQKQDQKQKQEQTQEQDARAGESPFEALSQEMLDRIDESNFDRFIAAYPAEGVHSTFEAQRAWAQTQPYRPAFADVLAGLERDKQSRQWQKGHVPNATKWLLERRWTGKLPAAVNGAAHRDVEAIGPDFAARQANGDGKDYLRDGVDLLSRKLGGEKLGTDDSERLGALLAVFQQSATKDALAWFQQKLEGGDQ